MTDLVPTERIEDLVGARRHAKLHYGFADSGDEWVYILHARTCLESGIDLRECVFSESLDRGLHDRQWEDWTDRPVVLGTLAGRLIPLRDVPEEDLL